MLPKKKPNKDNGLKKVNIHEAIHNILTLLSTNLAFGDRFSWPSFPREFALRDPRESEMLLLTRLLLSPPGAEVTGEAGAGVTGDRLLLAGTERCLRNRCSLLMITFPSDDKSPASTNDVQFF